MKEEKFKFELMKSFHEQFAQNQNHHQNLFIQVVSILLTVIIGFGYTLFNFKATGESNNNSTIGLFEFTCAFAISEIILSLGIALVSNMALGYRRDQLMNTRIREAAKITVDSETDKENKKEVEKVLLEKLRTNFEHNNLRVRTGYEIIKAFLKPNIIFNKWILHSRWWPDYLVRFFKRGKVKFSEEIHVPPVTSGKGQKLLATEENTIVHYNFQTISQFIERFNRYSDIESEQLISKGYDLDWKDIIFRPANEFFSRFFAGDGYKDGLHGLVLSLLQAFSEFVVYLKIWEKDGFKENSIPEIENVFKKVAHDFYFWQGKSTSGLFMRIRLKIKSKI